MSPHDPTQAAPLRAEPDLPAPERPGPELPLLSGIVVHWHNEALLGELIAAWPRDPRFELVVVDNGSSRALPGLDQTEELAEGQRIEGFAAGQRAERFEGGQRIEGFAGSAEAGVGPAAPVILRPGRNLGFAGAVNAGAAAARAPLLLVLNPDAAPEPGALDRLLEGFAAHPEAAGLAPCLVGADGEPQASWQLRRLPSGWDCLRQALPLPGGPSTAPAAPPAPGTVVEQPAAAALALRRAALAAVGGFDDAFYPAWFEDVDLAQRLRRKGLRLLYWPAARFRHRLGSTVPLLGYGPFLWVYYRNLERYLRKHHGGGWAMATRAAIVAGAAAKLPLLPVRRPRRAASRAEAARGLLTLLAGALSGWRLPRALAVRPTPPVPPPLLAGGRR